MNDMDTTPKRISNFHVSRVLHKGRKCEVYGARYAQSGGVVQSAAVKVLKPEFACIGEELRCFLREIDWARSVRHSLFPRIMEAGEHDGNYFLAMERVDGWTLSDVLRDLAIMQISMPLQVALSILHRIADGMQSMHEFCQGEVHLGLVHLSIEPSNIMVRRAGTVALIDFGETMASRVGDVASRADGKGAYQAPERLRMLPVDCRADIYSLGRVLESMSVCIVAEELDSELLEIIGKACRTHAEERFASMRTFMDAIECLATQRGFDFSSHACSAFLSEVFGVPNLQADPRAHSPRETAAPLRMPSEGMRTAHGLPMEPDAPERFGTDTEPSMAEVCPDLMMTVPGGAMVKESGGAEPALGLAESTAPLAPRKRTAFPDELIPTKAYNSQPDTDDELAVAIERLRR